MALYTVSNEGDLSVGIRSERLSDAKCAVRVGRVLVPLRENRARRTFPCMKNGLVVDGQPAWHRGKPTIVGRDAWKGAIVLVSAKFLRFEVSVARELPVPSAWPGIETERPAFVQDGRRTSREQTQLVIVAHKSSAIIADTRNHYITVDCVEGILAMRPTTADELGRYLVSRAENRIREHRGLLWTKAALKAIGVPHLWSTLLSERMGKLSARV